MVHMKKWKDQHGLFRFPTVKLFVGKKRENKSTFFHFVYDMACNNFPIVVSGTVLE